MLRYYKLFDLLFSKNMKLTDLREVLSSATVAKLRKGEYISGEALDKLCDFLHCQPADIVEHYKSLGLTDNENEQQIVAIKMHNEIDNHGEEIPSAIYIKSFTEPINENKQPISGWYEKELIKDYNNLSDIEKAEIDFRNARLNKDIYKEIDKYFNP